MTRLTGSRLPEDWELPDDWRSWAENERPDLNITAVSDYFKDFWLSKVGQGATKLSWERTWRNWVRKEPAPKGTPIPAQKSSKPTCATEGCDRRGVLSKGRSGVYYCRNHFDLYS